MRRFLCAVLLLAVVQLSASAPSSDDSTLNLFLDCKSCDVEHIRSEITEVNYVRDRRDADVHLLITTRGGIGILEYTLFFVGRRSLGGLNDTLTYVHSRDATVHERRSGLVRMIRLGLVRYYARLPWAQRVTVAVEPEGAGGMPGTASEDKWKSWSYRVAADGSWSAQESIRFLRTNFFLSAGRVTDAFKLELSANGGLTDSRYTLQDETITSVTRSGDFRGRAVWSVRRKWAGGLFASAGTSSFTNTGWSVSVAPAIEFTFFPYSESSNREARLSYFLTLRHSEYEELTLFGKESDTVLRQSLELTLDAKQPWGSAQVSLDAGHYLLDLNTADRLVDLYRVEIFAFVEVRLMRGLSFYVQGTFSRIRDQLFLPADSASQEDVLLGAVQLPTTFDYGATAGLSMTLGSIYSAVVNPRFGD